MSLPTFARKRSRFTAEEDEVAHYSNHPALDVHNFYPTVNDFPTAPMRSASFHDPRPPKKCRIVDLIDLTPDSSTSHITPPPTYPGIDHVQYQSAVHCPQPSLAASSIGQCVGPPPLPTYPDQLPNASLPPDVSSATIADIAYPSSAFPDSDAPRTYKGCTCNDCLATQQHIIPHSLTNLSQLTMETSARVPLQAYGVVPEQCTLAPIVQNAGHGSTEPSNTHPIPSSPKPDPQGTINMTEAAIEFNESIQVDQKNSFGPGQNADVAFSRELIVQVVTRDLEDICEANEGCTSPLADAPAELVDKLKMFYSAFKQPFTLEFYVDRIVQYTNCSQSAFIIALVYLDRLQRMTTGLRLSYMNCHRLLMVALVLAIKYMDDEIYSNSFYARVGGLSNAEMNRLEATMLEMLKWDLNVTPDTYQLFVDCLVNGMYSSSSDGDDESVDDFDDDSILSSLSVAS